MSRFGFDHTWCLIDSIETYKRLAEFGFQTDLEDETNLPENRVSWFLIFNNGYLEFIEDKSTPSMHDDEAPFSGFSLRADENLSAFYEARRSEFQANGVGFVHRNYNWEENSTDHLPGLNFLIFDSPLTQGIFTWVTEYENPNGKENDGGPNLPQVFHKNGCNSILGAYWVYNSLQDVRPLNDFLNIPIDQGKIHLHNGFTIYVDTPEEHYLEIFDRYQDDDNTCPYKAVVIDCDNLDAVQGKYKGLEMISFRGRPALMLTQSSPAWDIVIIETER